MAQTFFLYNDAALTSQFDPASGDKIQAESDGGSHDRALYLGSTDTTKVLEAASNPGVDQITVTPTDSAPGLDHETTEIKLALTSAGLDTATAGAALDLGLSISGGAANAVPIHIRLTDGTAGVASTELSLVVDACYESVL